MRVETVPVTVDMAEAWLATAVDLPQRGMTKRRVLNYASAMQRGQWRVTHQAIAIDTDGVLIDGQHRLSAVISAGLPFVEMAVAFDVPRQTFDAIDVGLARTTASTLHIAGFTDANALSAAARSVLAYDSLAGTRRVPHSDSRSAFTSIDVLDFLASPRGEVMATVGALSRGIAISLGRIGTRTWMMAGFTILAETDPPESVWQEFTDRMHSGAMLAETSPILSFRRWVGAEHGYARVEPRNRSYVAMAGLIKAWNAYSMGRDLSVIRFIPGRSTWPVPGRDLDAEYAELAASDAARNAETVTA
jgi:hypothetical protein